MFLYESGWMEGKGNSHYVMPGPSPEPTHFLEKVTMSITPPAWNSNGPSRLPSSQLIKNTSKYSNFRVDRSWSSVTM
jgi:hypothetical protein